MSATATEGDAREDDANFLVAFAANHPYVLGFVGLELLLTVFGIALDVAAGPAAATYTHREIFNVVAGVLAAFVLLIGIAGAAVAVTYYGLLQFATVK